MRKKVNYNDEFDLDGHLEPEDKAKAPKSAGKGSAPDDDDWQPSNVDEKDEEQDKQDDDGAYLVFSLEGWYFNLF